MSAGVTEASLVRLALSREVIPSLIDAGTLAVAVAGSAACGYAGPDSDLDLLVFTESIKHQHETRFVVRGIEVAICNCPRSYPFSLVDEGQSPFWVLREAARVRTSKILFERDGFLTRLKTLLTGLTLAPEYASDILDRALEHVLSAEGWSVSRPELAILALRNALLLTLVPAFHSPMMTPGSYYSKPKWEWRAVNALGSKTISELYERFHGLDTLTDEELGRSVDALVRVKHAVLMLDGLDRASVSPAAVLATVDEYLGDVEALRKEGQIRAAMAPLSFGLFELGALAAMSTGRIYKWSVDGLVAMERVLPHSSYQDCLTAARLVSVCPSIPAWVDDVRRLNSELRADLVV